MSCGSLPNFSRQTIKCFLWILAAIPCGVNCTRTYAGPSACLGSTHLFSTKNNRYCVLPILGLLKSSRPSAVLRGVPLRSIQAINTASQWAFPHVGQKVLEGIFPSLAYRDTGPSVFPISALVSVSTPLEHCPPRAVRWRIAHAVSGEFYPSTFGEIASTAFGHPCREVAGCNGPLQSALASTHPFMGSGIRLNCPKHGPLTKLHSGFISKPPTPLDFRALVLRYRVSFVHKYSMFGVSAVPPLTQAAWRAYSLRNAQGGQV